MITKNIGAPDRVIRIISGLALCFGAYKSGGPGAAIMGIAGVLAVFSGLMGWCGFYTILGIKTCKVDKP